MQLSVGSTNDSYKQPPEKRYVGRICGICYLGTQPGGLYDPRPMIMFRWELFDRNGNPSVDEKGNVHVITQMYSCSLGSDKSKLMQVLAEHGLKLKPGDKVKTKDWLGLTAWVRVVHKGQWANVEKVAAIEPDDGVVFGESLVAPQHWDAENAAEGETPPVWADYFVARSLDLNHAASTRARDRVAEKSAKATSEHVSQADDDRAAVAAITGGPITYTHPAATAGDDIPF